MFRKFQILNRLPNRCFPKIVVGCPCFNAGLQSGQSGRTKEPPAGPGAFKRSGHFLWCRIFYDARLETVGLSQNSKMLRQLTGQISAHYSSSKIRNTHLRLFHPDQGEHTVQPMDELNLLGVLIDRNLSFSNHISLACKKAGMRVSVLMRMCNKILMNVKLTIYKVAILPYLTYCSLVWHFYSG